MKRKIDSTYGDSLEQAVAKAFSLRDAEVEMSKGLNFGIDFTFEFHGIEVPLTSYITQEKITFEISEMIRNRAALYDTIPEGSFKYTKAQTGKIGEHLDASIPTAIQCAQLWGHFAWERGDFEQLRHVFEFNGVIVPFNPWKDGEIERILIAVEKQLDERLGNRDALVHEIPQQPNGGFTAIW